MEKIHPKRRHDKDNPYTIWKEEDGSCHLSFFDGERKFHELEIPPQLYQLFDRFELEDLSHLNKVDRHWSEEELNGKLVEHNFVSKRRFQRGTAGGEPGISPPGVGGAFPNPTEAPHLVYSAGAYL